MKITKFVMVAALSGISALAAVDVVQGEEKPAGCDKIADIRVGDLFNRHSRDIAYEGVIEEAKKMGAQKVSVQLVTHSHPKLGKSYTATGVAYRCGK
ncbi:MAG: hypothetical protein ACOY5B_06470 [Spirochaetota bacterium]